MRWTPWGGEGGAGKLKHMTRLFCCDRCFGCSCDRRQLRRPAAWTSASRSSVSGLVSLAVLGLAAWAFRRLRGAAAHSRWRSACWGCRERGVGARRRWHDRVCRDPAALALVWHRRGHTVALAPLRRWKYLRAPTGLAGCCLPLCRPPGCMAYVKVDVARDAVPRCTLGRRMRTVTLTTSDGCS